MGKRNRSRKLRRVHQSIKHIGLICAYFTVVQAIIWLVLTVFGMICFFVSCGSGTVAVSFSFVYMNLKDAFNSISCVVPPLIFLCLVAMYFILSVYWLINSCNLIVVFGEWSQYSKIKRAGSRWMLITAIICFVDFAVFVLFLFDLICISNKSSGEFRSMWRSSELMNQANAKRTRIQKLKDEIKTIDTPLDSKIAEDILNPFLQKKIWGKVSWPIKLKPKRKNATYSETIGDDIRIKINNQNNVLFPNRTNDNNTSTIKQNRTKIGKGVLKEKLKSRFKPKQSNDSSSLEEYYAEVNPILPTIICMIVAIKGLIAWAANITLLMYFKQAMKDLTTIGPFLHGCFNLCRRRKKRRRR